MSVGLSRWKRRALLAAGMAWSSFAGLGIAECHAGAEDATFGLRSTDVNVREEAAYQITHRIAVETAEVRLIAFDALQDASRPATARTAVMLLGDLKATEAVPLLVEHLTFKAPYKAAKRIHTLDDAYPCVYALIEIGTPAVDPLLAKLAVVDEELFVNNAAYAIVNILGKRLAYLLVSDRIRKEPEPNKRLKLERLLRSVEAQETPVARPKWTP